MEQTNSRQRLYQRLARLALALALAGVFVTLWSLWEYEGYGRALVLQNADLSTGSAYYDWNRNQMPVTSVALVRDSVKCSALGAGWVDVNSHLATWPGTVDGCHENGKLRVGKCHNGKGTNVEGVDAISKDVRMWQDGHLCVVRENLADVKSTVSWNTADGAKCPDVTGQKTVQCSDCSCWRGATAPRCPVSALKAQAPSAAALAAPWGKVTHGTAAQRATKADLWTQNQAKENWLVDVQVSLYGMPCKEQGRLPEPSKQVRGALYALLVHQERGCREGGSDETHTKVVQTQTQSAWENDNKNALSAALALTGYSTSVTAGNGNALLVARYQVETKCSDACRKFRFGAVDKVEVAYAQVWRSVRNLCIVVGVLTLVGLMVLLWVVLVLKQNARQSHYMGLLLHTVVVLVVAVALLCCLLRDTNHVHHLTHGARTALKHGCVADAGWAKVLRLYCEKTDLSSLHTWCAVLVGLLVVKLVVALVMAVQVVRQLAQVQESGWQNNEA